MILYELKDYLKVLEENNLLVSKNIPQDLLNVKIKTLCYNSNNVTNNTLFICKGLKYKPEYLDNALKNGAIAYIAEKENITNLDYPYIEVNDIRKSLSLLSFLYYNHPEEKLTLVGITGTKGKSTTAYYFKSIMDTYLKHLNKKDTAIVSSIDVYDGKTTKESLITSPESLELAKIMHDAVSNNLPCLVMEVSSQALKLNRVYGLTYDVGIFLNISPDHISSIEHPDFNDYFNSKLKLFKNVKNLCLNLDTDNLKETLEASKNAPKVITFSTKNKAADIYAYDIKKEGHNTIKFMVRTPDFDKEMILTMPGLFNVENALAAISTAYILNIPYKYIYEGLKKARTSGRMEPHVTKDNKIIAIVDYAHNYLSFKKLYESVKEEYPGKKIITVFGCPGGKAKNRREDLGLLSGANSYLTYLTAEDPGPEDVKDICEEIATFVKSVSGDYKIIEDRGEAIKKAILENPDSIILITGKGNETRQKYGTSYLPCKTDTEYVLEAFKEYENSLITT